MLNREPEIHAGFYANNGSMLRNAYSTVIVQGKNFLEDIFI